MEALNIVVLILFACSLSDVEPFMHDAAVESDIVSFDSEKGLNIVENNFSANRVKRAIPPIPKRPDKGGKYYMELFLVVDNLIFLRHGKNLTAVEHYCQTITHLVNVFFRPLNIYIALNNITVWKDNSHIAVTKNISETMDHFTRYYNHKLNVSSNVDTVLLLVDQTFDNSSVGISTFKSKCNHSHGLIAIHDRPNLKVAATIANEIGHMLGLHDEDESCNCVMSGSKFNVFERPIKWKPQTIHTLSERLRKGHYPCLENQPNALFQFPTCGNEFVEKPAEDCDCGPKDYCRDRYCNATTCRFIDGHHENGSSMVDAAFYLVFNWVIFVIWFH